MPSWAARAYGRLPWPYTSRRLLRLAGVARVRWLRPSYSSAADMIALADDLAGRGVPLLNLLFHSSEAIAGASPYTRNEGELEAFFERLAALLTHATTTLRARPMTMAEFRREFLASRHGTLARRPA